MRRRSWRARGRPEDLAPSSQVTPQVLFIHVMKTGGTTVMRNLRETFPLEEIFPYRPVDLRYEDDKLDITHHQSVPYLMTLSEERRRSIRVFTGHFPYAVRELLGIEIPAVTVLRDPVERTLSLLRQFSRKQPWDDAAERGPLAERSLEDIYDEPLVFGPLIHNHQTKIFSIAASDHPQTHMDMIVVDRERLEQAKANLSEVDVVGILERFDDFLDEIEARFGWQIVRGARKNATPETDIKPVDPALRRRIATDNAIDIEFYEYAKELVELRSGRRPIDA